MASKFLRRISQGFDDAAESSAPLNLNGAQPVTGAWQKQMGEFVQFLSTPVDVFSDLVGGNS